MSTTREQRMADFTVNTRDNEIRVCPIRPESSPMLEPVGLHLRSPGSSWYVSDYLTPEQAITLGRALIEEGEAAKAQESGEAVIA